MSFGEDGATLRGSTPASQPQVGGQLPHGSVDVTAMSVSELLGTYARILAELRARDVVRTNNAPVGDYAELLVARALGGTLAESVSEKSYDLICPEFGKVQVKGRAVGQPVTASQSQTSPFRSWNFDHAALVMVRLSDYSVHRAFMVPIEVLREHTTWRSSISGHVVHMRPPLTDAPGVLDISDRLADAARLI